MADLLSSMRDYLVAAGVVRRPSVPGVLHPMWIEPKLGVPAPGEGDNPVEVDAAVVLGAFRTGGVASGPYESFLRQDTVDVWIRTDKAPAAFTMEETLRAQLVDKRDWTMGAQLVLESLEWRPLQRLGSDTQGYIFVVSYLFWRRAV